METPLSDLLVIPVRDDETAAEYFKWLSGCNGPITIDTETAGTDWWDRCRMVQIGDANTVWLFAAGTQICWRDCEIPNRWWLRVTP